MHLLHFLLNKELKELYLSMAIKSLAIAMVGIFIPAYLYLRTPAGLIGVATFYLAISLVHLITSPWSAMLASRYGLKHALGISVPLYVLFYFLLAYHSTLSLLWIVLIGVIGGLADSIFWVALHAHMIRISDKKHRGEEVGLLYSVSVVSKILGPLIGALIVTFFSFNVLFMTVVFLYVVSLVPLTFSGENHIAQQFSYSSLHATYAKYKKALFSCVPFGALGIGEAVLWPLFIFLLIDAYLSFGFIFTVAEVILMVSYTLVGRVSDHGKGSVMWIGSTFHTLNWFIRATTTNVGFLLSTVPLTSILYPMIQVPFLSSHYAYAKASRHPIEFVVLREMFIHIGRILVLTTILLSGSLEVGFIAIAGASFLHAVTA